MANGTIKFYNKEKGFGFIKPDKGGPDIFFHMSGLNDKSVRDGVSVSYETEQGKKGLNAVNIELA